MILRCFLQATLLLLSAWSVGASARDVPENRKLLTTTTLSNGASLSVHIDNPAQGAFATLGSECETSVTVSGEASIGQGAGGTGATDVTYIFVLDKSGSLSSNEVLAMKKFFVDLTSFVFAEGSAVNAGVVFFDSTVSVIQDLTDDETDIENAINRLSDSGGTNCAAGLFAAAALASGANVGERVITIFAGDGECNDEKSTVDAAATALEDLGVLVETLAVFDRVDCNGFLGSIPRNGGICNDLEVPSDYNVDSLVGATLKGPMIKQDSGSYRPIKTTSYYYQNGETYQKFSVTVPVSGTSSTICIKATGEDALGDRASVEECVTVGVVGAVGVDDDATPVATCLPFDATDFFIDDTSSETFSIGGSYVIGGSNSCLVDYFEVVDSETANAFGPFEAGTTFYYIKSTTSPPRIDVGTDGVDWLIRAKGIATVRAVGKNGKNGTAICLRRNKRLGSRDATLLP